MAIEHVWNGDYDMALHAFSQVLVIYQSLYGKAHALVASAHHNLGTVHSKRASCSLLPTTTTTPTKKNVIHHHQHHASPTTTTPTNNPHTLQQYQRTCREQSLLSFQAAARSARDSLGRNHPNVAVSLVRIGFLLLQAKQYQHAVLTFQEALRIRHVSYGKQHSLVANLYNNLGVCHMHLMNFGKGRQLLSSAEAIQKSLLLLPVNNSATTATAESSQTAAAAQLELADTLCNIGGLCLEWIRRQGPDARHVMDAESAFEEALQVRILSIYTNIHIHILSILLDYWIGLVTGMFLSLHVIVIVIVIYPNLLDNACFARTDSNQGLGSQ